ncbi:proton-dependent oligopeptide transporter, POT family [Mytilus galloprovincialis]|uniref:Proton-dependent oligopeptide transporter, POT family n=1 Tax=Mytilus galloprovincialis TaxID=29158 RepID=A0A8B6HPB3_MYTGA|nr:proton-dependent oligopeptide transporter, POT family [Mytilus galloprovincialis]
MEETDPLLHSYRVQCESTSLQRSDQNNTQRNHPDRVAVVCIILTVMCERLAYYSVVANLILYCHSKLDISFTKATDINLIFTGSVFLVPAFGGYIADVYTGKYKTILGSGFIYILGLLLLFASAMNGTLIIKRALFGSSLVFITIGSGGIKSNIGPLGAEQVECLGSPAVQSFFNWFFWSINFGAVIAHTAVAYVQQNLRHFDYGYLIPLVVMIIGQLIFWMSRNRYITASEEGSPFKEIVGICWASGCIGFDRAERRNHGRIYTKESVKRVRAFCKILPVFGLVIVYFGTYAQTSSTFFLQSERLDISILSKNVPVAALGSFDNIAILILIPLMEIFIYPLLEKINRPPSLLQRMVLSVVAAGVLEIYRKKEHGVIQKIVDTKYNASSVSILTQIPQFTLMGTSEVFTSVSGMEFTYSEAPDMMKGVCMGLYLDTIGIGAFFALMIIAIVNGIFKGTDSWLQDDINKGKAENLFFLFAVLTFVNFILFIFVAKRYKYSKEQNNERSHDTCHDQDD